jgi:plasmid stability protein
MASITIPNVDEVLKERLQVRAAEHRRSMEAEARDILQSALTGDEREVPGNIAVAIRAIVEPLGGIELDIPPRKPVREPPKFE